MPAKHRRTKCILVRTAQRIHPVTPTPIRLAGAPEFDPHTINRQHPIPIEAVARLLFVNHKAIYSGRKTPPSVPERLGFRKLPRQRILPFLKATPVIPPNASRGL